MPSAPGIKGQVRIRLSIASEYLQHITRDSRAKLMREAVVGQSLIEITARASSARGRWGATSRSRFERGKSLGELSEELNKRARAGAGAGEGGVPRPAALRQGGVQKSARPGDDAARRAARVEPQAAASVLAAAERTLTRTPTRGTIGGVDRRRRSKAEGTARRSRLAIVADVANTAPRRS